MQSLLHNTRRPDVVFYRSGKISISSHAARLLDLESGDVIDIVTDGVEYFLYIPLHAEEVSGRRHEAKCYRAKKGVAHFRANSVRLCAMILDLCKCAVRVALPVGDLRADPHGRPLLPLLTCIPAYDQRY